METSFQNRAETEHHQEKTKKKKLNNSIDPPQPQLLPSPSSSPSHDFSFTISLHSSIPNPGTIPSPSSAPSSDNNSAAKTPNNSFAIDLSPADDIFFHGHLLPLHLLSNLPPSAASPRSSTNSLDSFTLPIKDLIPHESKNRAPPNVPEQLQELEAIRQRPPRPIASSKSDSKIARKSKSFNLFGMPRWRKVVTEVRPRSNNNTTTNPNNGTACNNNNNNSNKKKSKKNMLLDDASQLLKRYIRMMKPLLFSKRNVSGTSRVNRDVDPGIQFDRHHHQNSSFSGNLSARRTNKNDFFHVRTGSRATSDLFSSAPASIRTSPTNSGLLVPSPTSTIRSNDSSTMEELQAAIQAAITHCKNSIAAAEEGKAVKA